MLSEVRRGAVVVVAGSVGDRGVLVDAVVVLEF